MTPKYPKSPSVVPREFHETPAWASCNDLDDKLIHVDFRYLGTCMPLEHPQAADARPTVRRRTSMSASSRRVPRRGRHPQKPPHTSGLILGRICLPNLTASDSAEWALHFLRSVPLLVRRLARMSLMNGHVEEATFDGWPLRVLIRASGDHAGTEAYIVLGNTSLHK